MLIMFGTMLTVLITTIIKIMYWFLPWQHIFPLNFCIRCHKIVIVQIL